MFNTLTKALCGIVSIIQVIPSFFVFNKPLEIPSYIPLFSQCKSCQNLWTLRTHLTGVLVHGTGTFCYYDYLQFPHDCNLTLMCILLTLLEISGQRTLPPKLLVQMDNCVRENKNKYIFGFMTFLVEMNIFSEVSCTNLTLTCKQYTYISY